MSGACSAYGEGERCEVCTRIWWENLRERDHWIDPGVDGRIILMRIFRKWDVGLWTGLSWLRIEKKQVAGTCECGNEPSDSIKWGNFLTSCKDWSVSQEGLHSR
jgi:hypothetical protein